MSNQLEQLKQYTTVVADTGDFEAIAKYTPTDATTNPSLILKACNEAKYKHLMEGAVKYAKEKSKDKEEQIEIASDKILVDFGAKILQIIPGRVSTEIDALYSFDTTKTIEKAKRIIQLYEEVGINKDRILIKIASTWEGIQAAKELETKNNIHCNLTLLFSLVQAVECANSNVTLISPFVGRILDWYKQKHNKDYKGEEDPGVQSVSNIYNYYKSIGAKTIVMGASFRNIGEIQNLAGCDYLTISPELLDQLNNTTSSLNQRLSPENAKQESTIKNRISYTESQFRFELNNDAMATEKLAEGIRKFAEDGNALKKMLTDMLAS